MERSYDWMNEAKGDLEHAKSDMEHGYYNWACFSSQQAAEKAVKAAFPGSPRDRLQILSERLKDLKKRLPLFKAAHDSVDWRRCYEELKDTPFYRWAEQMIRFILEHAPEGI